MEFLEYLKLANTASHGPREGTHVPIAINLITNFTDTVLQKILAGVLLSEKISPEIFAVPYKQYHLHLKDEQGELYRNKADITFVFFDINAYRQSSFTADAGHISEVLRDIKSYCMRTATPVVMCTFATPYSGVYGNLFEHSPLFSLIEEGNRHLQELSRELSNLYVFDIDALVLRHGESATRDFRGLYAFDLPFRNDFLLELAHEWASYIHAKLGRAKKCIVLDLDNTLWGGVVGEVGPNGILIGPDYPGIAYQSFQHALLGLHERGIILAINSKNNLADVEEVFANNPHMILKESHFAAKQINWEDKAKNLVALAKELNIGLDSMVFLDDDAVNRNLVRSLLPEVAVPEMPTSPELYVPALYALRLFNQFNLTEEDLQKAEMYQQEKKRNEVLYTTASVEEYIAALNISLTLKQNDQASLSRLAQLTQKTNQFNLTTKRYTEKEIAEFIAAGATIFSGDVSDKFGDYGKTVMAIVVPAGDGVAHVDTFLMSCRVMGRGVEYAFLTAIANASKEAGFHTLTASFLQTPKNAPANEFLPSSGFSVTSQEGEAVQWTINTLDLLEHIAGFGNTITIK